MAAAHAVSRKAMPGLSVVAEKSISNQPLSGIQAKLSVNKPGDAFEREADSVADKVVRMNETDKRTQAVSTPGAPNVMNRSIAPVVPIFGKSNNNTKTVIQPKCKKCEEQEKLQRKEQLQDTLSKPASDRMHFVEKELPRSKSGGQPLPAHINEAMSKSMGVDFSEVRIHTNASALAMNKALHAHAFTHGKDIYFNQGMYDPESATGKHLLAHELTHVVQQGYARPLTAKAAIPKSETPGVQRWSLDDLAELDPFNVSIDDLVKKFAPELFEIKKAGGILQWIENKIKGGIEALINGAVAPVKSAINFVSSVSPTLAKIINWIKTAGIKVSKNDCSSFTELGVMVEQLVDELASPYIEKIKEWAGKASAWCSDMWQKFGMPVWDFIKNYIGDQWEMIKSIAGTIWNKTQPIRDWAESVWVRFKNWLGIGEGPEGQNGILQWIEKKITDIWDKIKEKIEPFKKQLMVVGAVLVLLSPAGPLLVAGAVFAGVFSVVNWIRKNIHSPADIVKLRVKFEKEILPALMQNLQKASGALKVLFGSLTGKIAAVVGAFGKLAEMVTGTLLSLIQSALQWVTDKLTELADVVTTKLTELGNWLQGVFDKVRAFVTPIILFLEKLSKIAENIMDLPMLILGGLWKKIPSCIRVPVEDFLVNVILKKVPFFEDVIAIANVWQKIKKGAMDIIKTVFIHGDLKGGILKAFKLFLDVLNIPVQLVVGIYNKAITAFDKIVSKPKVIFGHIVTAIKQGFQQFYNNFLKNSLDAVGNWIFSKIKGIKMPKEFSIQSIFYLVLDILGVTEDNIFNRIEKKTSKGFADKLRLVYRTLKGAAAWVVDILTDPKAAYEKAKQNLKDLKGKLFASIGSWIATNLIGKFVAQMTVMMASTPFGQAIEAIIDAYKLVKTAIEYAEKVLRVVDSVLDSILDLAAGVIAKAVNTVEKGLTMGLEVAVAFIAKVIGISDLPEQVKRIIEEDIRPVVNSAIDAVIDGVISVVKTLKEFLGLGGDKKEETSENKDGEYQEEFYIGTEKHTITASVANNVFILTMASNEDLSLEGRLNSAIKSVEEDSTRNNKEKKEILNLLRAAMGKVRALRSDYQTHINTIEIVKFSDFVRPKITAIINSLRPLEKYQIPGIHDLISVPAKRKIPSGIDIRKTLYDNATKGAWKRESENFKKMPVSLISQECFQIKNLFENKSNPNNQVQSVAMWKELKDKERIPSWSPPIDFYNHARDFQKFKYETDHITPLGQYWSGGEKNSSDSQRSQTALDQTNWEVLTDEKNRKKGGVQFDRVVGPDFESEVAQSEKGAKTILGIPFEDA